MDKRVHITGLLLTAFMVWMAHSMIPHHHHGGEICFNIHHCQESCCTAGSSPEGMCQNHDHHEKDDGCILKQVTFLPAQQNKAVFQQVQVKSELSMTLNPDLENPGLGLEGQPWRYLAGSPLPLVDRFHTSGGLRAPPIV